MFSEDGIRRDTSIERVLTGSVAGASTPAATTARSARSATAADVRDVIALLRAGRFPVADAVTRVVPLDAAGDALRAWAEDPGAVTRIHVEID